MITLEQLQAAFDSPKPIYWVCFNVASKMRVVSCRDRDSLRGWLANHANSSLLEPMPIDPNGDWFASESDALAQAVTNSEEHLCKLKQRHAAAVEAEGGNE